MTASEIQPGEALREVLRGIRNSNLGAFCTDRPVFIPATGPGSLSGLAFAVKDVFDIAGHPTGAGNPDWLRTQPPASSTASAVKRLLDAGATLVGKTQTDELTYSLNGENYHYGTPLNPQAPGRIPGGSSSGSAVAVAGGLVDFALGTDTGGSVRLPASNCGIYGFRPSHGQVPNDHTVPLAPSFDTVGWFAREATVLQRVGRALLCGKSVNTQTSRLLVAEDAFGFVSSEARPALDQAIATLCKSAGSRQDVDIFSGHADDWMTSFRVLQGVEAWRCHGGWIRSHKPVFGCDIRDRFEWAARIDPRTVAPARAIREEVTSFLDRLLGTDGVLCIPTSPSIALPINAAGQELEDFRTNALKLLCLAGLAGLPQVSLPLVSVDSCPLGVSLIGPRNSDLQLLCLVMAMTKSGHSN